MPSLTPEPASGGLVTSRDSSALEPGELAAAYRCIYVPDADHIQRQPGVSRWNVVATADKAVDGLTSCRFSDSSQYLVAQASGGYYTADAETNGSTFSALVTGLTGGSQLISVQTDNRHYLLNGVDRNRVLVSGLGVHPHGLKPCGITPTLITTAFGSAFSGTVTGAYYEYWCTEVVTYPDGQEVESTFAADGKPLKVYITSTATCPQIELSAEPANKDILVPGTADYVSGAKLYYRFYRSEAFLDVLDSLYPVGTKLQDAEWKLQDGTGAGTVRIVDTSSTANTGAKTAGSNDVATTLNVTVTASGGSSNADVVQTLGDSKLLRFVCGTKTAGPLQDSFAKFVAVANLFNFSFGNISSNIVGISVAVDVRANAADIADIYVAPAHRKSTNAYDDIPATEGKPKTSTLLSVSSPQTWSQNPGVRRRTITQTTFASTYSFGGVADDFLPSPYSWKAGDIDSNFAIQIGVMFTAKAQTGDNVEIDKVTVTVYYSGTTAEKDQKIYDAVVVSEEDVELKFGANGRPPIASTGCMFDGSLVLNDVDNPTKVVWSMPDTPDAFPTDVYYLSLPGADNDKITFLGTVNDRLIAGMRGSLWRINYLPSQGDATFSRGRAFALITDTVGIVRPTAACSYTDGQGQRYLAFVDANGVFATDGYSIKKLSADLRWVGPNSNSVIRSSQFTSIYTQVLALLNDPYTQTLRLVLSNGDSYAGSYATRHMKPGGLKWTKLDLDQAESAQTVVPTCACTFRRATGAWITCYGYGANSSTGGDIYREDSADTATLNTGFTDAIAPSITTRDIPLNGLGGEGELNSLTLFGIDIGTGSSIKNLGGTLAITQWFTNAARDTQTSVTATGAVSNSKLSSVGIGSVNCDAITIQYTPDTSDTFQLHAFLLRDSSFGEADNRA